MLYGLAGEAEMASWRLEQALAMCQADVGSDHPALARCVRSYS